MSYRGPDCAGVLLRFNNGTCYTLFPQSQDPFAVLSEVSSLAKTQGTTSKCVPAFFPELTYPPNLQGMMNVYAIEVPEDGRFDLENVKNQFNECYGSELLEGKELTIEHRGETVDHNEVDDACPSGTVLLAASSDMSRSSSFEFSPLQIPPTFHSPPQMEQNPNQNLSVATVSPSHQQSTSSNVMVSGNSNFPIPIPQDSSPVTNGGSYREAAPTILAIPPLPLDQSVLQPERKAYGETALQVLAIETPGNEEYPPLIHISPPSDKHPQERNEIDSPEPLGLPLNGQTVACQDTAHNGEELKPVVTEQCSIQEKERVKLKEVDTTTSTSVNGQQGTDNHCRGNSDMVIGMQFDRFDLTRGSERVHGNINIRTFSDPDKLDQLAVPVSTRATSLTGLTSIRRESTPDVPSTDEDGRPPLARTKSLPTSSFADILAGKEEAHQIVPSIQRQMSSSNNETVIEGAKAKIPPRNDPVLSAHVEEPEPESGVDFHVGGGESDVDDLSDIPKQQSLPIAENLSRQVTESSPMDIPSGYQDQPPTMVSDVASNHSSVNGCPKEQSTESTVDWLKEQVHILEHACNGACSSGEQCVDISKLLESVEQMKELVRGVRELNEPASDDLKKTIISHCDHCWDKECKVPHRAAGCLPAGECIPTSSSSSEESDTPYTPPTETKSTPPTSFHSIGQVSVDVDANVSTTSMVQEFQKTHRPTACTDEENHHQKPPGLPLKQTRSGINALDSPDAFRRLLYETPLLYGATPTTDDGSPNMPRLPTSTLGQATTVDMTSTRPRMDTRDHSHTHNYYDAPGVANVPANGGRYGSNFPASGGRNFPADGGRNFPAGGGRNFLADGGRNFLADGGRYTQLHDGVSTRPVFIQHNPEATARMRNRIEPASPALPEIGMGGFPPLNEYRPWIERARGNPDTMLIYSNQKEQEARYLVAGLRYPRPSTTRMNDEIDKGGNGKVYNYLLQGCKLAVKLTRYRPCELNMWYKLNHRNIVPLYGVMLHNHCECFQIMPRMTTNLRKVLRQCGDLHSLLKQESAQIWHQLICPNASYIFHEILCGLDYLHSQDVNVQHSDVKASNILILIKCQCPDILHCSCPPTNKYEVRIADFDSVKESKYPIIASQLPTVDHVAKSGEEMAKVMGTKTYRAPEQFQQPKYEFPAYKKWYEGFTDPVYNLEGPHCDIWSLGCIIVQFCIGALIAEDKVDVSVLHHQPQSTDISPATEGTSAITRFKRLASACFDHSELVEFGKIAERCLELDFKKRPTANELLKSDLFKRL